MHLCISESSHNFSLSWIFRKWNKKLWQKKPWNLWIGYWESFNMKIIQPLVFLLWCVLNNVAELGLSWWRILSMLSSEIQSQSSAFLSSLVEMFGRVLLSRALNEFDSCFEWTSDFVRLYIASDACWKKLSPNFPLVLVIYGLTCQ